MHVLLQAQCNCQMAVAAIGFFEYADKNELLADVQFKQNQLWWLNHGS